MSRKPLGGVGSRRWVDHTVVEVGCCVECKQLIFSDQEHIRAPRPLIGKVHSWCAPVPAGRPT